MHVAMYEKPSIIGSAVLGLFVIGPKFGFALNPIKPKNLRYL